jgi:hypothetical protein
VQSILGYSSAAITLSVYAHWFRSTKTSAMDTVVKHLLERGHGQSGQKMDTEMTKKGGKL